MDGLHTENHWFGVDCTTPYDVTCRTHLCLLPMSSQRSPVMESLSPFVQMGKQTRGGGAYVITLTKMRVSSESGDPGPPGALQGPVPNFVP